MTLTPQGLESADSARFRPKSEAQRAAALARHGLSGGLLVAPGMLPSTCKCIAAAVRTELGEASLASTSGSTRSIASTSLLPAAVSLS